MNLPQAFKDQLDLLERSGQTYNTQKTVLKTIIASLFTKLGKAGYSPTYSYDWDRVGYAVRVLDDVRSNISVLTQEIVAVKPQSSFVFHVNRYLRGLDECYLMREGKICLSKAFAYLWVALDDAGF